MKVQEEKLTLKTLAVIAELSDDSIRQVNLTTKELLLVENLIRNLHKGNIGCLSNKLYGITLKP